MIKTFLISWREHFLNFGRLLLFWLSDKFILKNFLQFLSKLKHPTFKVMISNSEIFQIFITKLYRNNLMSEKLDFNSREIVKISADNYGKVRDGSVHFWFRGGISKIRRFGSRTFLGTLTPQTQMWRCGTRPVLKEIPKSSFLEFSILFQNKKVTISTKL